MYSNGTCPTNSDGSRGPCPDAYGMVLGQIARNYYFSDNAYRPIFRNVPYMLLPRNFHVLRPTSHFATYLPTHGNW
jgi:hypothetical protein